MAGQFDAASDRVSRASAPDPAAGITFTCWFRLDVDRNDFSTLMRLHAAGGGSTTLTIGTGSDGVTMQVFSAGGTVASAAAVVGDWYRVGYTITGTSVTLYLADEAGATNVYTGTVTPGTTPTGLTIAGRSVGDSDEPLTGTIAYPRLWSGTVSTQSEVEAEWASATAVRAAGWSDWPLDEDLLDDSGNGRDLSAGTTAVTFVDGPPLATAITGSGAFTASAATASGAGTVVVSGVGSATAEAAVANGAGTVVVTGSGTAEAAAAVVAGAGTAVVAGQGSLTATVAVVAGAGQTVITGAGVFVAPAAVVSGVGGDPVEPTETPAERTYTVPAENRVYTVPFESRVMEVVT